MSDVYSVEKFMTPSGSVHWFASLEARPAAAGTRSRWSTMASTLTVARAGRDSGSRTRQKNPNEPQPSIARGVLELDRDAPEERPQDDDRERQPEGRLRAGRPRAGCRQPEVADQDEQRQDRDGGREQQPEREQRVQRLAAAEPDPGEDERGERRAARRSTPTATTATITLLSSCRQNAAAFSPEQDVGVVRRRPTGRDERDRVRRPAGRWSLKPPRTAYTIGRRIAAATASRTT